MSSWGRPRSPLAVALGLLVVRSDDRSLALDHLSVFVALAAAVITAGGLAIMGRGTATSDKLAAYGARGNDDTRWSA